MRGELATHGLYKLKETEHVPEHNEHAKANLSRIKLKGDCIG